MKVSKKARKLKNSGKADDYQARTDGLRILARMIARSYGKQSLPQEIETAVISDKSSLNHQAAENGRDFLQ